MTVCRNTDAVRLAEHSLQQQKAEGGVMFEAFFPQNSAEAHSHSKKNGDQALGGVLL